MVSIEEPWPGAPLAAAVVLVIRGDFGHVFGNLRVPI